MFRLSKKNLLNLEHLNNSPLFSSNNKGEANKLEIKKIKQRIILKINKDINGMEINHGIIKKKIKILFGVNYNKSAKLCNPCMDACKKVNNKVNGRKLSNVSNKEITELLKVCVSS